MQMNHARALTTKGFGEKFLGNRDSEWSQLQYSYHDVRGSSQLYKSIARFGFLLELAQWSMQIWRRKPKEP